VTLRIAVASDDHVRHVHLDGRLTGDEVGELEQVIGGDPRAVCLELENLRSADAEGLVALRRLRAEGVELRGVPPHLAWRIEEGES
jgi:anti-sigma factor RsiW